MLIPHPPALPGNKSAPEGMGQIANYECFPLRTISPTVLGCSRSDLVITCNTHPLFVIRGLPPIILKKSVERLVYT